MQNLGITYNGEDTFFEKKQNEYCVYANESFLFSFFEKPYPWISDFENARYNLFEFIGISFEKPEKEKELTQLDRIEAAANMKNSDIAQAAIDEYTLELVKEGVL